MTLKDVLECCGDKSLHFEIHRNSWSSENMIDTRFDNPVDFAFCEVLQIIPLQGDREDPKPAFALVVDPNTYDEEHSMIIKYGSLQEYLQKLPKEAQIQIDGIFTRSSIVVRFFIEREYPKIPVIRFEVADSVISMIVPNV